MKKFFTTMLFFILGVLAFGEKFEKPVLLTSVGQSADVQMVSVLLKKAGVEATLDKNITGDKLGADKTVVIAIGGSSKGLGAAGIKVEDELARTEQLLKAAKDKGIKLYRTLTGFKYIGEKIRQFETKELDGTFLFGFEESIGYLVGTHVRDKDAVVATLMISEMAAYYNSIGTTVYKELNKLYDKYGWYVEETVAITKQGKDGLEEIGRIMENLRTHEHEVICGKKVECYKDFKLQIEKNMKTGTTSKIDLPKSDVIQFILEDGTYVTARPSGTEPKIKYYICVVDKVKEKSLAKLEDIKTGFQAYVDSL